MTENTADNFNFTENRGSIAIKKGNKNQAKPQQNIEISGQIQPKNLLMQSIDNLKDHMEDLSFIEKSESQDYAHKGLKRQLTKEDVDEAKGAVQLKRRTTIKEKQL